MSNNFERKLEEAIRANSGQTTYDYAVELRTSDVRVKTFLLTKVGAKLAKEGLVATHNYPEMKQPRWFNSLSAKEQAKVPRKRTDNHSVILAIPEDISNKNLLRELRLQAVLLEKMTRRGSGARRQRIRKDAGHKMATLITANALIMNESVYEMDAKVSDVFSRQTSSIVEQYAAI